MLIRIYINQLTKSKAIYSSSVDSVHAKCYGRIEVPQGELKLKKTVTL